MILSDAVTALSPREEGRAMPLIFLCSLLLAIAWIADLITPQPVVVSILLNIPIALSALARRRWVTIAFVVGALLCNATAGWYDAYREGYVWDVVAIANRLMSSLSFLLVGWLTVSAQRAAEHASEVAAKEAQGALLASKNEALAAANRELAERGDFIRDIMYALSHDLRTPLAAAGMTMRQAREGAYGPLPELYRDVLERSIKSSDELQRLAETLLLVARYESGDRAAARDSIDLRRVAEAVVRDLAPLAESKQITLAVSESESASTDGDESELRRALMNLTANALTWTPKGGHVSLRVTSKADEAEVAVDDDGYGVPDAVRDTLFERFSSAASRRGGGTGLGLYLVRRVAESHGGSVSYEARTPRGSRFMLHLPPARKAANV
jgi:signal transduction histidine kinase